MLTEEQIKRFAPKNARYLTDDEISIIQNIDDEELKQLANAYPNGVMGVNYLVYHNATEKRLQRLPQGTYQNLYNLRTKLGQKQWTISNFVVNSNPQPEPPKAPIQKIIINENNLEGITPLSKLGNTNTNTEEKTGANELKTGLSDEDFANDEKLAAEFVEKKKAGRPKKQ